VYESAESVSSFDWCHWSRRRTGRWRGWRALVERSVWTLAVVVLDEDAQDMFELTRSQD